MERLKLSPKQLFLIDGSGALLTTLSLTCISTYFQNYFGMPRDVLYFLATLAFVYSFYSIFCYFFIQKKWKLYLKVIVIANIFYCFLIFTFLLILFEKIKILDLVYFLSELFVLTLLIFFELNFIRTIQE